MDVQETITQAPEPGIYRDVSMAKYLAIPYASASLNELIRRSPKQARHALDNPKEPTDTFERGTALHMAVLEPDLFADHYVVIGKCEGRYNDGRPCAYMGSFYRDGQSFCKKHDPAKGEPLAPGLTVMQEPEMDKVLGMRDAILSHRRAASLFEGAGEFELTMIFDDPDTGVRVKIRPDRLVERAGAIVDIKTTRDAAEWWFPGDAERRGYFRKLALYRRGLQALDWPYRMTAVLAIESEAPYDLIPYLAEEKDLDSSDAEVSRLLARYDECQKSGEWPGYTEEFKPLFRPTWAKERDQEMTIESADQAA